MLILLECENMSPVTRIGPLTSIDDVCMNFLDNLFFYTVKETVGSLQVTAYLQQLDFKGKLCILPPGSGFNSPHCLKMRSLDPIVVYAFDRDEMARLGNLRDEFFSFRVFLVLSRRSAFAEEDLFLLRPRLVFSQERGLEPLGKIISALFTSKLTPEEIDGLLGKRVFEATTTYKGKKR